MTPFRMKLMSATQTERIDDAVSFVGTSETGQFGILAHAGRRMEVLDYGLARFRHENGDVEYLAFPGGVLYFVENELSIATGSYIRHHDFNIISSLLEKKIRIDEEKIKEIKQSLHMLDQEILKRLTQLKHGAGL